MPPWQNIFLISWTGMRGVVTLAAALALPVTTAGGQPFPFRAEIILISFAVILATLVLQGLSLTPLIRILKLEEDHGFEGEERLAREQAAAAALDRLNRLAEEAWPTADHVDRLRLLYGQQRQRFALSSPVNAEKAIKAEERFRRLRHETLSAERLALISLRDNGTISDELLHQLEHELDVEALRHGIGEQRVLRP
jgi:CPA1 family monovalent cation:H+ antiporter